MRSNFFVRLAALCAARGLVQKALRRARRLHRGIIRTIAPAAAVAALVSGMAIAAGDYTRQEPVEVRVSLGDEASGLRFSPNVVRFETGKLYKLVLHNPSQLPHYFSSEGLAGAVFTRKVQVNGPDGKPLGEVKGHMREIEVYPKATVEWWFVPVRTGVFNDLKCTIAGHEAMTGVIEVR